MTDAETWARLQALEGEVGRLRELVGAFLRDDAPAIPAGRVMPVVAATAAAFGLRPGDLIGTSRTPKVAEARQAAMHIAVQRSGRSLSDIGRVLRRDHTTVAHGNLAAMRRAAADPAYAVRLADAERRLDRYLIAHPPAPPSAPQEVA